MRERYLQIWSHDRDGRPSNGIRFADPSISCLVTETKSSRRDQLFLAPSAGQRGRRVEKADPFARQALRPGICADQSRSEELDRASALGPSSVRR